MLLPDDARKIMRLRFLMTEKLCEGVSLAKHHRLSCRGKREIDHVSQKTSHFKVGLLGMSNTGSARLTLVNPFRNNVCYLLSKPERHPIKDPAPS